MNKILDNVSISSLQNLKDTNTKVRMIQRAVKPFVPAELNFVIEFNSFKF